MAIKPRKLADFYATERPKYTTGRAFFETRLETLVDKSRKLVKLGREIDRKRFEERFRALYCLDQGRPGANDRLMIGVRYLKYLYDFNDLK
ncbi:MAG: hypothetical protein GYA55_06385 [SAR324 cluster bacterium]|uniref:Transposase InsH N-terminal domain-containing protein n=1 Tax=SAR324 cluster bacterium TaxID=2024889 RepID=A0A7X9FR40_9DELT|nr:hypothetical protein [SAR324 cluster bacterium]